MPKSKKRFKPAPTTKKPEVKKLTVDEKISVLETIMTSFIRKNTEGNLNDDLTILEAANVKVLYNVGFAINDKDRIKAREFVKEVLQGCIQQVDKDIEETKQRIAEEEAKKQEKAPAKKATKKPKVQKLNSNEQEG